MIKLDLKNFNIYTLISVLMLLGGVFFYIYWGLRYNVWYDIGPYALSIVLIIPGIIGIIFTLMEKETQD